MQGIARKLSKLALLGRRPTYWRGVARGVFAAVEHEAALAQMPPLRTILDVGAHHGQFSLVAKAVFPGAKIFAFEPQRQAWARYTAAVGGATTLFPFALGGRNEHATLHVPTASGAASLLPGATQLLALFPEVGEAHQEMIEVRRLADLLEPAAIARPALLKLDVQGYELEVLRSMPEFLPLIDYIIVEASYVELYRGQPLIEEVRHFLSAAGFTITAEASPLHSSNGGIAQVDLIAQRV